MKNKRGVNKFVVFLVCILAVSMASFLGSASIGNETNSAWYDGVKSSLTPPNWVFPIAWTIIFFLLALAIYYAWTSSKLQEKYKKVVVLAFESNLILNVLWSPFFFYSKEPLIAFVDLLFLWLSIITLMLVTWKLSRKSAYMLIPYLLWVSFAGILNFLAI